MRLLLPLFFVLAVSCGVKKRAQIRFDSLKVVFRIKQGDSINVKYTFTNTGNDSLRLFSVTGDCSCAKVKFSNAPIAPMKKGEIHIKYNSSNDKIGPIEKAILVESNTKPILNRLSLKGIIE
jgi:hypothetical protein